MDKVFINDRKLIFTNQAEKELSSKMLFYENEETLKKAISILEEGFVTELYLFAERLPLVKQQFTDMFKVIHAAGGLVKNKKGNILFIYRRGKWDLPKGKMEKGETPAESAIREVSEECGISDLTIVRELSSSFHAYPEKDGPVLKETHWFEMKYGGKASPVPQLEEDITEAKWLNQNKITKALSNTYGSIRELILEVTRT